MHLFEERKAVRLFGTTLACLIVLLCTACGRRANDIQATQRPKRLTPFDTVKSAGSDFRAFYFKWFDLPGLITLADREYTHQAVIDHFEKLKFDPAHLTLKEDSDVRVYFVGEGSGYVNSLCVNLEGVGLDEGIPRLLFPNVNTKVQLDASARLIRKWRMFGQWGFGKRSDEQPLRPGDFIDLGKIAAGRTLSFFITANDEYVYTPVPDRNPDQKPHMVGIAVENSPYVRIGFEDMLNQGDADFEDAVFAVEVSEGTVQALLGRFDPWGKAKRLAKRIAIMVVIIGTPIGVVAIRRRTLRRRWRRFCRDAERSLEAQRPSDALIAARKAERNARSKAERRRCQELILSASEACNDLAGLSQLYDATPEIFSENEPAALAIGRTQIETNRMEAYGNLRKSWESRETSPAAWLALDADAMAKEERTGAALNLLNKSRFAGPDDGLRLARVARLLAEQSPAESEALAARAVALNPRGPDPHLLQAAILEEHGKLDEAHSAFSAALRSAPADPIARDRLAEFYCRTGRYSAAMKVWHDGLRPPSIDFIWTKFLFWSRVTIDMTVDWESLEPPPGELRPLIDCLLRLEPERFWNDARFGSAAKRLPMLLERQEVQWLRILESLRRRRETEARWLLSFERSGRDSWHPHLEAALLRIVLYRQTESLGPFQFKTGEKLSTAIPPHPFFAQLDQYAQSSDKRLPSPVAAFLKSECVFAAVCFAAGWKQAGLRLARNVTLGRNAPSWARECWQDTRNPQTASR